MRLSPPQGYQSLSLLMFLCPVLFFKSQLEVAWHNKDTLEFNIIIIIKKGWQCKPGREQLTPYQSEDPNPTTPTHRMKEENGKTAGDKK